MNHMNNTLIENIKIKSDLQYDFLFESNQYEQLDSDLKLFLKESYDSGVNFSIDIQKDKVLLEMIEQDPLLLESIDEGLWDRFKAGAARVGQGLKNVTGIGQQTTDSKDAGVASLFNGFKNKFQKSSTPPAAKKPKIGDEVEERFKEIEEKTKKTPPIDPNQGLKMVDNSNAPKGLKDKIKQAIVNNPGKTKFLLGVLSFGAGVAAAAATGGNPIAGKIVGSLINGIGNAAIAKAQGRGNGDAVMSGLGGAIAGYGLANLGATATNAISNFATGLIPGADPNAYQVTKTTGGGGVPKGGGGGGGGGGGAYPFDQTNPNKLYPDNVSGGGGGGGGGGGTYPFDQTNPNKLYPDNVSGGATGTGASSSPYQAYDPNQPNYTGGVPAGGTVAGATTSGGGSYPFDQTNPNQLYPDTGVDTSVTTNQSFPGTKPEDIVPGSANDPNQGMYATAAKKIRRFDPTKGAELLQRGFRKENVEKTFTKSYNNTYVLNKKSNVISENEKQLDETWEENINEALNAEQQKVYDEFLTDLGKMFKQPKDQVIPFMQSQGSRFKDILDFINAEVNPSTSGDQPAAPDGGTPGGAQPAAPGSGTPGGAQPAAPGSGTPGGAQPAAPGSGTPGTTPSDGTIPPSGLTKELQSKLDDIITPDFLSGLVIQFPEKIRFSKLENNTSTLLSAKSLTKIALKISKDKVLSMLIKCQINNTTLRFQTSFKPEDLNQKLKNLFEITFDSKSSVDIFKRKLVNTLAIEFSKNPVLSGGKSSKDLSSIILSYLNPKIDDPIRKMVRSIYLTVQEVSYLIEKEDIVYIGISNKGIKFIQEKSSSDIQKPAEKTADDPKAPNVGWTDPRKSGGDDDRGDSRQEESKYKLFESNNRENKNIFKLR